MGRAKARGTSMNGERNAEDVGEVGNRSVDEWEASPCHSFNPFPRLARPCSTSPLVLSERLRFHPRSHVGTPTTVYRRRRPTSNGLLTPSHSSLQAADQDPDSLPILAASRFEISIKKRKIRRIYIYVCAYSKLSDDNRSS